MDGVNMGYNPANLVDAFGNFKMVTLPQTTPKVEVVVEHTIPQSVFDVVAVVVIENDSHRLLDKVMTSSSMAAAAGTIFVMFGVCMSS